MLAISDSLSGPTPSDIALRHTRFSSWFPRYRPYSIKASFLDVLEIQPDFLQWLAEDGLILPMDSDDRPIGASENSELVVDQDGNDDTDGAGSDSEAETIGDARDFAALNQRIREIIDKYEGAVFPKLDWSAPLDAAWMVPGATLRCTEPSDVYLLLKSSDFVNKDIAQLDEMRNMSKQDGEQASLRPTLVLKKYFDMPRANEFRCFVRAGRFVCVSQRETGTFLDHLQDPEMQKIIVNKLNEFYHDVLKPGTDSAQQTFPGSPSAQPFPIVDFVWDAYLTRDLQRCLIVDINPYIERTDSLLWEWDEIEALHAEDIKLPHLRIVTSRAHTTQSFPTYAHNMMPADVFDLSHGADIANFAKNFHEQLAQAVVEKEADDHGVRTSDLAPTYTPNR
jgi:hypothetical protein